MKLIVSDRAKELGFQMEPATKGSAGYDIMACIDEPIVICPNEVIKIGSGIKVWAGSYTNNIGMLLLPRSSIDGLVLNNTVGLIDNDYQGEIIMKVRNISSVFKQINPGDRMAQLVFFCFMHPRFNEVEVFDEKTSRGEGGFGHTGK